MTLWSKLNQKDGQNSRSNEEKKKKLKHKPKPKDIYQDCGRKGHWSGMPECPKHKDKKGEKNRNSANYTVDNLHPGSKMDLGEREVEWMLMVRENIGRKELLLDCGATAYMFNEQHYFASYTPAQTTRQYIIVGGHNQVPIAGQESVRFQAKLPAGILTVVLHNVIHVPGLGANLVSLGALYRKRTSVQSIKMDLVIETDSEELFYTMLARENGTLYHI